jgi:hypothetical protein
MAPPTLATLKNNLAPVATDAPVLAITRAIVRSIIEEFEVSQSTDDVMTTERALARFRDDLPPSTLYHTDCLHCPPLYRIIRDVLSRVGVAIMEESPNQRLSKKVALTIYASSPEDLELAKAKELAHDRAGTSAASPAGDQNGAAIHESQVANSYSDSKNAHNVSMRMKDYQYSGAMTESLVDTIHLYSRISNDYDLSPASRLKLFHNAFRGEALRFYDYRVIPTCSTFAEASLKMREQYNSRTRQSKAKATLGQLRLDRLRMEKGITTAEALEKLREQISALTPQCPSGFTTDAHAADALVHAVRGEPWASETLKRHGANPGDFQSLFHNLESALVFDLAEKESMQTAVHFEGFASDRYGIPRRPNSKSSAPRSTGTSQRSNPPRKSPCFGCGSFEHWLRTCPDRHRVRDRTISKLGSESSSAVLYSLVNQVSDLLQDSQISCEDNLDHALQGEEDNPADAEQVGSYEEADNSHLVEEIFF